AVRWRAIGVKPALSECGSFAVPLIPAAILAYLVMGLVWPWSVLSPLNPFRAVEYFSNFFEKPWRELFDGQLIPVIDMPRSYVPTLFAVQLPELLLALGLCGTTGAIFGVRRTGVSQRGRCGRSRFVFGACAGRLSAGAGPRCDAAGNVQGHPPLRLCAAAVRGTRRICRRLYRQAPRQLRESRRCC